MENIPEAERLPLGKRALRLTECVLEGVLGMDRAPGSIRDQRLTARQFEIEMRRELPPTELGE